MEKIIFALPGNELLARCMAQKINAAMGELMIRQFPDGESYVRAPSDVSGKEVIIICTLNQPNNKLLPLFFLAQELKDSGAKKITLIAPYLAYMRQDIKFNPGEAITSKYFAKFVSFFADELITIDPHLHRWHAMSDIYSIPCKVLHASQLISEYIKNNIKDALLIGPDSESEQWVSVVAKNANAPFIILQKERLGDKEVKITVPQIENAARYTPVLVDDIISTAHTMIETVTHLKKAGMQAPVCIGVHAIFAGDAYEELKKAGAAKIITCNTVNHSTNDIDVCMLLSESFKNRH